MRVLLVSNTYPPADISGVGTLVAELAAQLRAAGHEALVLVRRAGPAEGVVAVGGGKLLFPLRAALAIGRVAGGRPFDVVHVHESDGVLVVLRQRLARLLGRASGRARVVATLQVSYLRERLAVRPVRAGARVVSRPVASERLFRWARAPFHALLGRLTARLADAVVAPSAATARELADDYGARGVRVIPNGVALPAPVGAGDRVVPDGGPTVLFVGRLRTRKAVAVLLEAFARVARALPAARLVVLGDGEQRPALEEQRRRLGLEARVDLAGAVPRDETAGWLRRADVFCLPSTYEGFPLAILEAMAEGLPVVATRVAGVPEAVEDGASGILVDAEDDAALAAALLALLGDPARRRAFGARGRSLLAERFAIERVGALYVELFRALAAAPRGAAEQAAPRGDARMSDAALPPAAPRRRLLERAGRLVLSALLLGLLVLAARFDRTHRPLVGDESTFAMQAESLAFDLDLRYTRADYDRFVRHWQRPPDGLILQSLDHGATLTYGKPALYALAVAPFVRLSPLRGAGVANVLFLAAAAFAASAVLRRPLGPAAPWCVACWVFGSVVFAYAFWEHAEVFLLAAVALAFAAVYGVDEGREPVSARRDLLRFAGAGALLAAVAATRIFYLALLLPLLLAVPLVRRRARRRALLAGAALVFVLSGLVRVASGGEWTGYGGERRGFYPRTGFPEVEFPARAWPQVLEKLGNTSWTQEGAIPWNRSFRLWAWDVWYFVFGRNVGLLPYFLPIVLGVAAFRPDRGRWAIPLAVGVGMAGFLLVRPHNFFGGVGALGDRYFVPFYPALWFLAARPLRARAAAAVAIAAGLFVWPLWRTPTLFPVGDDGRFAYVMPAAERLLPYETTLSHVPGGQDFSSQGLWMRFVRGAGRDGDAPFVVAGARAEVLVASPAPLDGLRLDFGARVPAGLAIEGAARAAGTAAPGEVEIVFRRPSARHPMWWSDDDWFLYRLRLRVPADASPAGARVPLRLLPALGDPGF